MFKYILVGYISLYLVIWFHEVGHAFFYYKYGCKNNVFNVTVPLYLIFSTPQPIDEDTEKKLNLKEKFIIGMGGILVNMMFGFIGIVLIKNVEIKSSNFYHFFWYSFILFHFVEAASYTVLNNIIPASDIKYVQDYKPLYRIPIFLLGLIFIYFIINLLNNSPMYWKQGLIIVTLILALLMGVLRVVFGYFIRKQHDEES